MSWDKIWNFIIARMSVEVPDEMSACLDCDEIQCSYARYENCANRLAMAAAMRALRDRDANFAGDVGRQPG
jgi:hypothetical protein